MKVASKDAVDVIPFSEQVDKTRVPQPNDFLIERHVPASFGTPYHHHTSIEINFLQNCAMTYSFSGQLLTLDPERITVFWGAAPHRVTNVNGNGKITNIYLSLGQFIRWGLPGAMVEAILGGAVIVAAPPSPRDVDFFDRLYGEKGQKSGPWRRVHLAEIETRLRRLALEGWTTALEPRIATDQLELTSHAMQHVESMLKSIADNFTIPINVSDIAQAANLSTARAGQLFKQVMGVTIKQHLQRARLSHARMLLTETNEKISTIGLDSGYPSLSAFYESFGKVNNMSPARYRAHARRGNPFLPDHASV
jgi:AraC-like DNA-binding protein